MPAPGGSARRVGASIALSNVVKRYGTFTAVSSLSLAIEAGEFVSFLGPSGSGKTTSLLMVAGFILPTEGAILLGNQDITGLPPHRRNIGMVYQNYALFPHMTVFKNVAFPLRMRGISKDVIRAKVMQALELVQLQDMAHRYPAQLSGGQQQRVALARALVFEPPLLLMDEPLGALDKKLREELQSEIKRIQRKIGSTVIYVTHDQDEALSMSDRVVVMKDGRIEQVGSPKELYETPRTRFVAGFLGSSNFLDGTLMSTGDISVARTEHGTVVKTAGMPLAGVGSRVTLAVRPERVAVSLTQHSDNAAHPGHVVDANYFGTTQRYEIKLDNGEMILANRTNIGDPLIEPGSPVFVSWRPEDVWIIPAADNTQE